MKIKAKLISQIPAGMQNEGRWQAHVTTDGECIFIGEFETKKQAKQELSKWIKESNHE